MNKKILIPVMAVVIAGTAAFGAVSTFAQTETDPQSSIIQKLAQRFNLKEEDVKAVFDEQHSEMRKQMKAKMQERLNQAVASGKITEEQKKLILDKQAEMKTQMEVEREKMQSMTEEERHAAMEAHKGELEKWAADNGIDLEYLQFKMKFKGGPGMMHMRIN